jgi:hypothetical protein
MESHWLLIAHALEQIEALEDDIRGWLRSDAYTVIAQPEPDSPHKVLKVKLTAEPRTKWAMLIGDIANTLRASLDHTALHLARKHYPAVNNGTALPYPLEVASQFPIVGNENRHGLPANGEDIWRSTFEKQLAGVDPAAVAVIKTLQPYQRGAAYRRDKLWIVNQLAVTHKHRDLHLTAFAITDYNARAGGPGMGIQIDLLEFDFTQGPVEDGTVLLRYSGDAQFEESLRHYFRREIAFGEGTPVPNQPVVPLLRALRDHIRMTVLFELSPFL